MIAQPSRGALLFAAFLLMSAPTLASAQAPQGPTPATSPGVVRLLVEWTFGRVMPPMPRTADTAAAPEVASSPLKAAVSNLPMLRPGATRSFLARQLQFPRVRRAYEGKQGRVVGLFGTRAVVAPEVFFRVFKREQVLEVWVRNAGMGPYELMSTYPVCKLSGRLGPKRREGDRQIPEGFYEIDLLNPQSNYHLSMRVDYPNPVDRARGGQGRLGGDIYIHGGCATIGCVPVTDEWIEELYLIAIHAQDAGQETIPVHIFPTRLDPAGLGWLEATYGSSFPDYSFWQNLQEGYLAFERTRAVPAVGYDGGRYTFHSSAPARRLAPF